MPKTTKKKSVIKRGRPKGTGRWGGVPTKTIRVPVHLVDNVYKYIDALIRKGNK